MLSQPLEAIVSNRFQGFIDDSEIVREHSGDVVFVLNATDLPKDYELDGLQFLKDGEYLFELGFDIGDGTHIENGYLMVGIGDLEEADLKIDVPMGELNELVGLELTRCPIGLRS